MTKTLSGNKRGTPFSSNKKGSPSGEIMPRRSKREYSPSGAASRAAGFDSEAIRRAIEASSRSAGNDDAKDAGHRPKRLKVVTPDGKKQTPLAKLRSIFGYDTGVQSEDDSGTSKVANTKAARMPSTKTGANNNMNTSDEASRSRRMKMIAGYNDTTGDETENVAKPSIRQKQALLKQLYASDDDDSIPDSMFPGWVQESNDTDEDGSIDY